MLSPSPASGSKAFPAVRHTSPQVKFKAGNRATSGKYRSKNQSFLDNRNSDAGLYSARNLDGANGLGNRGSTFGFRNHSHALGSTLRHFTTISDFPELPANVTRTKGNEAQVSEWQRKTKK